MLNYVAAEYRPNVGVDRGHLLVVLGEEEKGVAAVQTALAASGVGPDQHFTAARVYSLAAKATTDAKKADALARKALAELLVAEKEGYFSNADNVKILATHPDFIPLRSRDDFRGFLTRLQR